MLLYDDRINAHRFELVSPLIAPEAVFWFGDGSHRGIDAIEQAFAATWAELQDEIYWLEDVEWLAADDCRAACIYRFCWTAMVDGAARSDNWRGTAVLARRPGGWQIVHEHSQCHTSAVLKRTGPGCRDRRTVNRRS